jgi:hypothetical protein
VVESRRDRWGRLPFDFVYGRMRREQGDQALRQGMRRLPRRENDRYYLGMIFGYSALVQVLMAGLVTPFTWAAATWANETHRVLASGLLGFAAWPTLWLVLTYVWIVGRRDVVGHCLVLELRADRHLRSRFYAQLAVAVTLTSLGAAVLALAA